LPRICRCGIIQRATTQIKKQYVEALYRDTYTKEILNYFYYALLMSFSALIFDGYIQFFVGENILGVLKWENNRVSSFFNDELIMGSYLSRLSPLLLALFVVKKKKNLEIFFMYFFFILLSGLIFISGERASFFFLTLSLLFL
jgi:hypothetical protein